VSSILNSLENDSNLKKIGTTLKPLNGRKLIMPKTTTTTKYVKIENKNKN